jgi:hypothetical protein
VEAGKVFVGNLLGMAEDCFEAESVDLERVDIEEKLSRIASGSGEEIRVE